MQLIIDARKKKKKKKSRSFYLSTYIFQPPLSNFSLHEYIHGVVSRNIFFSLSFARNNRFETPRGGKGGRGSERKGTQRGPLVIAIRERIDRSFLPSSSHYYASRGKNFLHGRDSRIIEFTDSGVENSILNTSIFKGAFIHPLRLECARLVQDRDRGSIFDLDRILKGYRDKD